MRRVRWGLASRGILFQVSIALLYLGFLFVPSLMAGRLVGGDPAATSTATLAWLALPVNLARHGMTLQSATMTVTIAALAILVAGALLSIVARMRGSAVLWAAGGLLFGCAVAILMPATVAVGFVGALLLVLTLRSRFVRLAPVPAVHALLAELWPVGYAAGFAALAWRYNPQILLQCLLIAFGVSLVGQALLPARRTAGA